MAEHFHWTLEYIDGLPVKRFHEWLQIKDARAKIAENLGD